MEQLREIVILSFFFFNVLNQVCDRREALAFYSVGKEYFHFDLTA